MFERKLTRKEVELIKEIEAFIKDKHGQAQDRRPTPPPDNRSLLRWHWQRRQK
jgi:hypothetical protein